MARAGTTPVRLGPRPLNSARHPSTRWMENKSWKVSRKCRRAVRGKERADGGGIPRAFRVATI